MRGINKATILGTLGRDVDMRYSQTGTAIATVSVATSEKWKDKNSGEQQERTEWHRLVMFGKLAEIAQQFLVKGSRAYFEGMLQTRSWEKDGQTHYTTEIKVHTMEMVSDKPNQANQPEPTPQDNINEVPF